MYKKPNYFEFKRENGSLLSQLLLEMPGDISLCGGNGSCGNCRVRFLEYAPLPTAADRKFFTPKQLREGYRLACKAKPDRNCRVEICFLEKQPVKIVERTRLYTEPQVDITYEGRYFCVVDVGTTTVAMQLISAKDGGAIASYAFQNPQRRYGSDVLARIQAAGEGKAFALRECLWNELLKGLEILEASGEPEMILFSGNTTMAHLLLAYPAESLGAAPFRPAHIEETEFELGGYPAVFLPGISAFAGADLVSGLYAWEMGEREEMSLLIDLGTNAEMALGNRNGILCTSAAAGCAFEGGVRSDALGTDLLSLVYDMRQSKILDETGLLSEPYFTEGCQRENIRIFQSDIRSLQTAKAAICAGAKLLLEKMEARDSVRHVYLAGGFGYYLNVRKAVGIGLLPRELEDRCRAVGNASLAGLIRYGMEYIKNGSGKPLADCRDIVSRCRPVNLAKEKGFEAKFIEAMALQAMD